MSDPQTKTENSGREAGDPAAPVPLFIDLDGTLVKSDLLLEGLLLMLRKAPWRLLMLPLWLAGGIARLKAEVAKQVPLSIERLPLQEGLAAFLRERAAEGRPIYLATAANRAVAEKVAGRVGLFSGVLASDETTNLKGARKLKAIQALSSGPFDFAGNGWSDLPVWGRARKAIVVNPGPGVTAAARRRGTIEHIFDDRPPALQSWIRGLRLYQWMKNFLLGVPILTAHAFSLADIGAMAIAFVAFGLVASSAYMVNDLIDLDADRLHPRKRRRPFAAGDLSIPAGLLAAIVALAAGLCAAALLSRPFLLSALAYLALTMSYSLFLKRVVILDVILLGALYTVRIVAGAAAIDVAISSWLLAFSMFVFFSIALVKRSSEILILKKVSEQGAEGRDYRLTDYPTLKAMGIASGYLAVLVLALYIDSAVVTAIYRHPYRLWLLCPLMLYWISRLWIKTARGEMHDDPLMFSLRDRVSWAVLAAMLLTTLLAI
jgi:4-hydroxybenzoate polyprenyltransferase/phosphoserine phosphatase